MNVALVAPSVTVTVAGTVAPPVLLLDRLTTRPPAGAADPMVTVPVELPNPPITDDGLNVTLLTAKGLTMSVPDALEALKAPPIVTLVAVETTRDVTVNVALDAPAGTSTVAGTVAAPALLLVKVTVAPPVGAFAFSVTVPVELPLPPSTAEGSSDTLETTIGLTVNMAVLLEPLNDDVIVTLGLVETNLDVTVKVALVAP